MTQRILVLDGNERSALAATRSLGSAGQEVLTAEARQPSLAGRSRHAAAALVYASPHRTPEAFVDSVAALVRDERVDVLLPMTDVSTELVLRHRERFRDVRLPYPDYEAFSRVTDKARLMTLADECGVRVPQTVHASSGAELHGLVDGLRFPLVVKPVRSKMLVEGQWRSLPVCYAGDAAALDALLENEPALQSVPVLAQQRLTGEGRGLFGLYDSGRPVVHFAHRRLRERPPSGGVSVLSESIAVDEEMAGFADAILARVGWHGVAMAEFKMDEHGRPYLIEINGRFWGSLQLAVDAGVDFPVLLHQLATGRAPTPPPQYQLGCRSRWLLGDLDSLYMTIKQGALWQRRREVGRAVAGFLRLPPGGARYDVNRLDDLRPFLHELRHYIGG